MKLDGSLNNYVITDKIFENKKSILYRALNKTDNKTYILKVLNIEFPHEEEVLDFLYQTEIIKDLKILGIPQLVELIDINHTKALVFKDDEAKSLNQSNYKLMFLEEKLAIFYNVLEILEKLHDNKIVHKDINPSNIIYNETNNYVGLIDFENAAKLSDEKVSFTKAILEGTLDYISPEQTGRLNRSIDYRSDLYSLGATFFEIFSGEKLFPKSKDLLELIYFQVAKEPEELHSLDSAIPLVISRIIKKLLSKNVEDRYQSASGVKEDIKLCLDQLNISGKIKDFEIGKKDKMNRFFISEKLYGRDEIFGTINKAYTNTALGGFEIVLVSGEKGVGKTSLSLELQNLVLRNKGLFNYGKFSKNNLASPYGALELFSSLVKNILSENNELIEQKRNKILKAVGNNGKLLFDFIPELKFIIGEQSEPEVLAPTETKNRLIFTFIEFLKIFTNEKNPLIIYLDDVQFANETSLEIFKALVNQIDLKNLMLVFSYEEDEKSETLKNFLHNIRNNSKGNLRELQLHNLSEENIKDLLKDSTNNRINDIDKLSSIILKNTNGVSFLVKEFLKTLYNKKILSFNNDNFQWIWNEEETKNLKFLKEEDIAKDLFKLCDENELSLLNNLAILGRDFNFETIEEIFYSNNKTLHELLNNLLAKGLIEITEKNERKSLFHSSFKFKSQTLFQLIENQIPDSVKKSSHLLVGKFFMKKLADSKDDTLIFETLSHLNYSLEENFDKDFIIELANLNFRAGLKARNNSAFKIALTYFETAYGLYKKENLVPETIYLNLCETAYSSSEYEKMKTYFDIATENVKKNDLKLKLIEIKINSYFAKGEHLEVIQFALETLKTLGIVFPKKVEQKHILQQILRVKLSLIGKKIENLSELPLMNDSHQLGIMRVLGAASVSAFLVSPEHFMLISMKQLELSLKYGNAPQSSFAYTTYGVILCGALGDLSNGYKFGQEALKLLGKFDTSEGVGSTTVCAYLFNLHWKDPLSHVYKELHKAYNLSLKSGNVEFASWALLCRDFHGFFSSKNLKTLREDMEYSTKRIEFELKQESQYYTSNSFLNLVEQLIGSNNKNIFDTETQLQARFEKENYKNGLYYNYSNAMIKNLIYGNYQEAYSLSQKADLYVDSVISTVNFPAYYFYSSLSFLLGNINPTKNQLKLLNKKIKALKKWGEFGPDNHYYKYEFAVTLYKRIIGNEDISFKTYDAIIKNALKNGFLSDGALISEIVSIIAQKTGNETLAFYYIHNANDLYNRWGAFGKVQKLNEEYSIYKKETTTVAGSVKNGVGGLLDSVSLIKISELLTAENQYDKLISKMTEIVMENAGAERGFFISKKNNELFVELEFNINDKKIKEAQKSIDEYDNSFSKSLINYSCRTGEVFVYDDILENKDTFNDEYFVKNKIKSLLVLPVIAQNKIIGAFYLENNLISGVFTKQRMDALKVIALQGAIAIENIRVYNTLEEKVKERTFELKLANENLEEQKLEAEKARNIADEATRIKSEFLANMSHEIRTPMNGVMGLTYLLRKTQLNERQADYLDKIEDSAKHLLNVINDILDFSKVEAGKIELDKRTFKLEDIFNNISNIFVKPIEDKGLELIQYIDPAIPKYLIGDDIRLKQTLINLIGNAVKFTHKGEIIVKVQLMQKSEKNATILFSVKDSGIGLSPEQKNKLFKSFTQADGSITRKYGGTGLGLAISKSFVELMGGEISVTSELEKGSLFYFELNLDIGEENLKIDPYNLTGLKTLIVDDSETSLEILKAYTENYGCLVDTCYSGEKAIELLKNSAHDPYKLMLIDWKMPGMDGLETIENIKSNSSLLEIPLIIMVSAFNIDEIKQEGNKLNINGYLTKPVQQSSLLDTILDSFGVNISHINVDITEADLNDLSGSVLLVEDNKVNQMVAKEILESFGLTVTIVENGLDAISKINTDTFDLIFMDIQMPGIDGYETTERIKATDTKTPIIAMTANVLESDVQKCRNAGMDDYIGKPINPEELYQMINKWLKRSIATKKTIEKNPLPNYVGINIHTGLRRAMGKVAIFNKVLKIFVDEFINAESRVKEYLKDENKDLLLKYLHTLKGASGNISAEALYEQTSLLEFKVKNWSFTQEDLSTFYKELNLVLENEKILEQSVNTGMTKKIDQQTLENCKSDLFKLKDALSIASFDSESIFEDLELKLKDYDIVEFKNLKVLITNFEYEKALELLNEFLKDKI